MRRKGQLFIVGLGPGAREAMTGQALDALQCSRVVVGYSGYFESIGDLMDGKECLALPLGAERERAQLAVQRCREGESVCVISSGDAGIFGMAGLVLETLETAGDNSYLEVAVIPGVSAVNACAALLGAPLGHDFAVVSLSDLLTPWSQIERRLTAAAQADFVLVLLNPRSPRRDWQWRRAGEILLHDRLPETPVGIVRQAYRPGQSVEITTLGRMTEAAADMFATVIVGSSQTRRFGDKLVTPLGRNYRREFSHHRARDWPAQLRRGGMAGSPPYDSRFRRPGIGPVGLFPPQRRRRRRASPATGSASCYRRAHGRCGAEQDGLANAARWRTQLHRRSRSSTPGR